MFASDASRYAVFYSAAADLWLHPCTHERGFHMTCYYYNVINWHIDEVRNVYPTRVQLYLGRIHAGTASFTELPVRQRMPAWWDCPRPFTFGA